MSNGFIYDAAAFAKIREDDVRLCINMNMTECYR